MKVYFALYDQSYANGSQYWTWFPEELSQPMRDSMASKQNAFKMRLSNNPPILEEDDIQGGIIYFQDAWYVVYRYFDGKLDPQNRPGRIVLATAWVKANDKDADNVDLYDLFNCEEFKRIQAEALKMHQIPAPEKGFVQEVPLNIICEKNSKWNEKKQEYLNIILDEFRNQKDLNFSKWRFESPAQLEEFIHLFPYLVKNCGLTHLKISPFNKSICAFDGTPLPPGIECVPPPKTIAPPKNIAPQQDSRECKQSTLKSKPSKKYWLNMVIVVITTLFLTGILMTNTNIKYTDYNNLTVHTPDTDATSESQAPLQGTINRIAFNVGYKGNKKECIPCFACYTDKNQNSYLSYPYHKKCNLSDWENGFNLISTNLNNPEDLKKHSPDKKLHGVLEGDKYIALNFPDGEINNHYQLQAPGKITLWGFAPDSRSIIAVFDNTKVRIWDISHLRDSSSKVHIWDISRFFSNPKDTTNQGKTNQETHPQETTN